MLGYSKVSSPTDPKNQEAYSSYTRMRRAVGPIGSEQLDIIALGSIGLLKTTWVRRCATNRLAAGSLGWKSMAAAELFSGSCSATTGARSTGLRSGTQRREGS